MTFTMALLGLLVGTVLGFTARMARFCSFGAIEDARITGDWRRARSWALAIAIAIATTHLLAFFQIIDLSDSIHMRPDLIWLSLIVGGLCFGIGMAQVGTCPYGALVRLGTGDLRALVTIITIGITGYMTMRGLTSALRISLDQAHIDVSIFSLPSVSGILGAGDPLITLMIGLAISTLLVLWCFKSADFRASKTYAISGLAIGLAVAAGWFFTGYLGQDDFDPQPLVSVGFISSVSDGLVYLMTFSGATINFSIATVGGVALGSFAGSLIKKEFKLEAFDDSREMGRHLIGAAMMGFGGIVAMGCTLGQGVTGLSTLSIGSLIATVSIAVGAVSGLHYLLEDTLKDTIFAIFRVEQ